VSQVKQHDCHRLGFVVTLARSLAEARGELTTAELLGRREVELERSVLQHDDVFSRHSLTNAERRWLSVNRSPEAKRWNVLTTLNVERLLNAV
jgi:hypothetical protein